MPTDELSIVHQYVLKGWKVAPTGSRFICPRQFVGEYSDWDLMVLNEPGLTGEKGQSDLRGLTIERDGSGEDGSYRVGMLNIILLDAMKFQAWTEATEFAIQSVECWKSREKRIDLFKKMEKIVVHRGLDSILDKRKTAPSQSATAAVKTSRSNPFGVQSSLMQSILRTKIVDIQ